MDADAGFQSRAGGVLILHDVLTRDAHAAHFLSEALYHSGTEVSSQEAGLHWHPGEHLPVDIGKAPVDSVLDAFIAEAVVQPICIRYGELVRVAVV